MAYYDQRKIPEKYGILYDRIIAKARLRRAISHYSELHHIVPRSLGGSDEAFNLVRLNYREHFLVHWLLTKMHIGISRRKMLLALHAMTLPRDGKRIVAAWQFEAAKRALKDLAIPPEIIRLRELNKHRAEIAKEDKLRASIANSTELLSRARAEFVEPERAVRRNEDGRFKRRSRQRSRRKPRLSKRNREILKSQQVHI